MGEMAEGPGERRARSLNLTAVKLDTPPVGVFGAIIPPAFGISRSHLTDRSPHEGTSTREPKRAGRSKLNLMG